MAGVLVGVFVGVAVGGVVGVFVGEPAVPGAKATPLKAVLVAAVASVLTAPDTTTLYPVVSVKTKSVPPPVPPVPPVVAYRVTFVPEVTAVSPRTRAA